MSAILAFFAALVLYTPPAIVVTNHCPPVVGQYYSQHDTVGDPLACFMYENSVSAGNISTMQGHVTAVIPSCGHGGR